MRKQVYWLGAKPSAATTREFKRRNMTVVLVDELPNQLDGGCGAVFNLGDPRDIPVFEAFVANIHRCLDNGLLAQVLAGSDAVMGEFQLQAGEKATLPDVVTRTKPRDFILAQGQAEHSSGLAANGALKVTYVRNLPPLKAEDLILLQRAFHDCSELVLDEMTGGLSEARVFAAYMTMSRSDAGRSPQPQFVKIDRRKKIEREHYNYSFYAERFIPFGQRPNIDAMVKGHSRALLKGSFVDRSESLWEIIRRDMATSAITHLFDETLNGWHDQAYSEAMKDGSVAEAMRLAEIIDPHRIKPTYLDDDVAGGPVTPPAELWSTLAAIEKTYRVSPCHGDLHAENVRVQNGRAILIDMASVAKAPITTDIAALETWVAFNAPPGCDMNVWRDEAWEAHVDFLYKPAFFVDAPEPPEQAHPMRWMTNAVRQLRQRGLAAQTEAGEYQIAVAVQLLRRCQWADGKTHDIYRRMHGYRIAERLVRNLASQNAA